MPSEKSFYEIVDDICLKDQRYKADSYEFVMQALNFTQKQLQRNGHVSATELLEGIRQFALKQFGPMTKTVLQHWGISKTEDFGHIVFNMIQNKLFSKTEDDSLKDFQDVYDFEAAFKHEVTDLIF